MREGSLIVDYSPILPLLGPKTFTDYRQGEYQDRSQSTVQKLLRAGFVEQKSVVGTYPDLSGSYEETGITGLHPLTLSMTQASPVIHGSFRFVVGTDFFGKKPSS